MEESVANPIYYYQVREEDRRGENKLEYTTEFKGTSLLNQRHKAILYFKEVCKANGVSEKYDMGNEYSAVVELITCFIEERKKYLSIRGADEKQQTLDLKDEKEILEKLGLSLQ